MEEERGIKWLIDKYVETFVEMIANYSLGRYTEATIQLIGLLIPVIPLLLLLVAGVISGSGSKPKKPAPPLYTEKQWNELMVLERNARNGVIIPPFDLEKYERGLASTKEEPPPAEKDPPPNA